MKHCNGCNTTKPLTEFHKRADGPGLRSKCKTCSYDKNRKNLELREGPRKPKVVRTEAEKKEAAARSLKKYRSSVKGKAKNAAREAARRAAILQATPSWLTEQQKAHIAAYYELAALLTQAFGFQFDVDHIHPLKGKNFRGLHVPWNLQIMEHTANVAKNNKIQDE